MTIFLYAIQIAFPLVLYIMLCRVYSLKKYHQELIDKIRATMERTKSLDKTLSFLEEHLREEIENIRSIRPRVVYEEDGSHYPVTKESREIDQRIKNAIAKYDELNIEYGKARDEFTSLVRKTEFITKKSIDRFCNFQKTEGIDCTVNYLLPFSNIFKKRTIPVYEK